jgi:hypothetical protein
VFNGDGLLGHVGTEVMQSTAQLFCVATSMQPVLSSNVLQKKFGRRLAEFETLFPQLIDEVHSPG